MKLLTIFGYGEKQVVREQKLVSALKATNQVNPRSSGTTLVCVPRKKYRLVGVLLFDRGCE